MIKWLTILFALLLMDNNIVLAQLNDISGIWGSHLQKADQLYHDRFYEEAIIQYEKELERRGFNKNVVKKLADSHRILGHYNKANDYYVLIFAVEDEVNDPMIKYHYAEVLTSIGKYKNAGEWYEKYLGDVPSDKMARSKLDGLGRMDIYFTDSSQYKMEPYFINTNKVDLGPVFYKNGILFSSGRNEDLIINHDHLRTAQTLIDLFYVNDTGEIENIILPQPWKSNDGPVAVGRDYIVVTRNIGYNEDNNMSQLGLFFFTDDEQGWVLQEKFSHNNDNYSIMHPALSDAADTLFFSSNMTGGFGGKDLYYSVYDGKDWSSPVNMGESINSPADEIFPYYHQGILYFASNGHPGLGGLDVFKAIRSEKNVSIYNVGAPINSGWDDFSYSINNNKGYFVSNRPGGQGFDDIYSFEYTPPVVLPPADLTIIVKDYLNDDPVTHAEITFINKSDSSQVYSQKMIGNGKFTYQVDRTEYSILISSLEYSDKKIEIDLYDKDMMVEEIYLLPDFELHNVNLDSILFSYNDFKISADAEIELSEIIHLMKKYPSVSLEISSHTDSRGKKDYNLWLSEMRATSTANFLLEQGIDWERMIIKGYGESELLNNCADGVECSEDEHSVNRRIEFKFNIENTALENNN